MDDCDEEDVKVTSIVIMRHSLKEIAHSRFNFGAAGVGRFDFRELSVLFCSMSRTYNNIK